MATAGPKLGLALSGGGHRAAFFHIGLLAKLVELGLRLRIVVISTVSGGSIAGALDRPGEVITDADHVNIVRDVERQYRKAATTNTRGYAWANRTLRGALPRVQAVPAGTAVRQP